MPKAIFFSVPAHGHINPSLPLVAKLIQHGHEIIYFTTETYRQRVTATGASIQIYAEIEDDYFGVRGLDGSIPQLAAQTLLITTKSVLPGLLEWVKKTRPDYILYDCMCPWGYYMAQIMKLPSVSSSSQGISKVARVAERGGEALPRDERQRYAIERQDWRHRVYQRERE